MKTSCMDYTDRIVDYVDGELPRDEAQRVAQHLAACEDCRRTAQALERSLGLAKVIWSDNLGDNESAAQRAPVRRARRIRFYAVAASILIAASILMLAVPNRHPPRLPVPFEEIERQIVRAGMAAELLCATRIVAQCEGTESIVEQQYRYILREYAGTAAAESIKASYNLKLGDAQHE